MAHERKKGHQRKDKKNARMREDVAQRHEQSTKQPHQTDQHDIQVHKPGSAGDESKRHGPP